MRCLMIGRRTQESLQRLSRKKWALSVKRKWKGESGHRRGKRSRRKNQRRWEK